MTREEQRTELLVYRIKDNCYEVAKKLLNEHDKQIRAEVIKKYMSKLCKHCMQQTNECYKLECPFCTDGCDIINIAEQVTDQKGE